MVRIEMIMDGLGNIDVPSRAIIIVVNPSNQIAVAAVAEQETHLIVIMNITVSLKTITKLMQLHQVPKYS